MGGKSKMPIHGTQTLFNTNCAPHLDQGDLAVKIPVLGWVTVTEMVGLEAVPVRWDDFVGSRKLAESVISDLRRRTRDCLIYDCELEQYIRFKQFFSESSTENKEQ